MIYRKFAKLDILSTSARRLRWVWHLLVIFCAPADVATIPASKQDLR